MTDHETIVSGSVRAVTDALLTWRADEAREEQSRATLHAALRAAMRGGVSAYRLAGLTGLSERHIGRIREEGTMSNTRTYWTCVGSVRGECGVHHRTEDTAAKHCAKDDRDVKCGNGRSAYSDRRPVERAQWQYDDERGL